MPSYKVVGIAFADSDNSVYINSQLNAIKKEFPSVEIELADETDSRLHRHIKQKPGVGFRLPIIMLLKDTNYMTHRNGKNSNLDIIGWLKSIPGLNA